MKGENLNWLIENCEYITLSKPACSDWPRNTIEVTAVFTMGDASAPLRGNVRKVIDGHLRDSHVGGSALIEEVLGDIKRQITEAWLSGKGCKTDGC